MAGFSVVIVLKGLVEVAAMLLLALGAVRLLSFGRHEGNPVYRLLQTATAPLTRATRRLTPAVVADRHLGLVTFLLLFWAWLALLAVKFASVSGHG